MDPGGSTVRSPGVPALDAGHRPGPIADGPAQPKDRSPAAGAANVSGDHGPSGDGIGHDRQGEPVSGGPDLATSISWLLALVGFVVGARTITDNSFLTHLATGQLIIAGWSVPTVDPYAYSAAGAPWTVQSWLASLVYAGLDATAGGWAIRLLHGLVGAAAP